MTQQAAFWDKIAPKYAKTPIADPAAYHYTLGRTRTYVTPNDRVLELGCGTGSTALLLANDVAQITAIDVSPGMLAIAGEKTRQAGITNVTFELGADVPRQGEYDVVMAYSLFHLVPDMETRFAQINDLLATGGYFISKTACLGQRGSGLGGALKSVVIRIAIPVMQLIGKAPFVRSFSIKELEDAITAAGFEIVESGNHPMGPPPARYIAARKL